MVFWLDFFELISKRYEEAARLDDSNPATPANIAADHDNFRCFALIKNNINLLVNCIKFVLIMDPEERAAIIKCLDIAIEDYDKCEFKLPSSIEHLKEVFLKFPRGMTTIHSELYDIITSPGIRMVHIIKGIPVNLYYSVLSDEIRNKISEDPHMGQFVLQVQHIYGICMNIYNYHKKNEWSEFNPHYDELEESALTSEDEMDRSDQCPGTPVQH